MGMSLLDYININHPVALAHGPQSEHDIEHVDVNANGVAIVAAPVPNQPPIINLT